MSGFYVGMFRTMALVWRFECVVRFKPSSLAKKRWKIVVFICYYSSFYLVSFNQGGNLQFTLLLVFYWRRPL